MGSVELDKIFTFSSSQIQLLYTIGAIVVVVTVFTGVFSTKEIPLGHQRETEETGSLINFSLSFYYSFFSLLFLSFLSSQCEIAKELISHCAGLRSDSVGFNSHKL